MYVALESRRSRKGRAVDSATQVVDGRAQYPPLCRRRVGIGVDDCTEADTGHERIEGPAGIEQGTAALELARGFAQGGVDFRAGDRF